MPDSAAPPIAPAARTRQAVGKPVLFVTGLTALAFNLRAAITGVPPVFPELASRLNLSPTAIAVLAAVPVLCFAVFGPAAAWCSAGIAAVPWHRARRRCDRVHERAAAQPGQAALAGQGGPADWDLPARAVRGRDPGLAGRGAGVPGIRGLGVADAGNVGAASHCGGAGVAAARAVPDGSGQPGRVPAGPAATREGVQAPARMAGDGLHGTAEPDLLRCALVAADPVPGPGCGSGNRGHTARTDESRQRGHRAPHAGAGPPGPGPAGAGRCCLDG